MIDFNNQFLKSDESNVEEIIEKFLILHQELSKKYSKTHSRILPIPDFKYSIEHKKKFVEFEPSEYGTIIKDILEMFEGCMRPHSPHHLFNILPSPLLNTLPVALLISLVNPNGYWDFMSGKFHLFERRIVNFLANIMKWNIKQAGGILTSGGKSCLLYAIKIALNKQNKEQFNNGVDLSSYVLCSERAHYSIESICSYLGIGANKVLRVPCYPDGTMNLRSLKEIIYRVLNNSGRISCVILNLGTTIDFCIDPIENIREIFQNFIRENKIHQLPHFHIDSVIGWAWLLFKNNKIKELSFCSAYVEEKIHSFLSKIPDIKFIDSMSADFHKIGSVPYISSFFVTKSEEDLLKIVGSQNKYEFYGDLHTHHFSLENSRSVMGIATAWASCKTLGIKGFMQYILKQLSNREMISKCIISSFHDDFEILNEHSLGFEIVIKINFGYSYSLEALRHNRGIQEEYAATCIAFKHYMQDIFLKENPEYPLIGYIHKYQVDNLLIPAFLLYPMYLNYDKRQIFEILKMVQCMRDQFVTSYNKQEKKIKIKVNHITPPR